MSNFSTQIDNATLEELVVKLSIVTEFLKEFLLNPDCKNGMVASQEEIDALDSFGISYSENGLDLFTVPFFSGTDPITLHPERFHISPSKELIAWDNSKQTFSERHNGVQNND